MIWYIFYFNQITLAAVSETAWTRAKAEAGDHQEAVVIIKEKDNELDQDDRGGGSEK